MDEPEQLMLVGRLVSLSQADWKYADLYLQEAEVAIAELCTREQFRGLLAQRSLVKSLAGDLRRVIQLGDWREAKRLASEGSETQSRVRRNQALLSLAEKIYGKRTAHATSTTLALSGVVAKPARVLEHEISKLRSDLRALAKHDSSHATFYESRAAEYDRLVVDLPEDPPPRIDPSDLKEAALTAAEGADFAAVLRIARAAVHTRVDRLGRIRAPRPSSERVGRLAEPFPRDAVERARRLGLHAVTVEPEAAFNSYLSCCCSDRAVLPMLPLSEEQRELEACTCGHACPPEAEPSLKSSLDALMVHPFLTSGGTRYLPWFGRETLVVEAFSEAEPDARTPLLASLSLPGRQALSRLAIEDALLSKGPRTCEDLGLDPTVYRIICVPFDVYKRLAERHDWGRRQLWTHFDGFQVTRDLKLQAMVGGDRRYGGPDDLCGVGRGYESDHITARFAIVRRDRFEAREARDAG